MDNGGGGGGCCIARYGGGGGYDIPTIDRIMMKFRPIAPKPANGSSSSPEMSENSSSSGRRKRRLASHGIRRCNNSSNNRKRKIITTGDHKTASPAVVVTLPLLPETPEIKSSPTKEPQIGGARETNNLPACLSFGRKDEMMMLDQTVEMIGSCVTVECVTDTWVDLDELGCTDRVDLERDRCPGFISDGYGRVTWVNEAYKEMVREGEGGRGEVVVVWLVMKDKVAVEAALASHEAFTCRVRVQNKKSCGSNSKERSSSIILPCDVWRMDGGCFAWRLDLTAALSLGR